MKQHPVSLGQASFDDLVAERRTWVRVPAWVALAEGDLLIVRDLGSSRTLRLPVLSSTRGGPDSAGRSWQDVSVDLAAGVLVEGVPR